MVDMFDFEDKMDSAKIFTNGISGKFCHRESYDTLIDFEKLKSFIINEFDKYTSEQWVEISNYFDSISYLSPINKIISIRIIALLKDRTK